MLLVKSNITVGSSVATYIKVIYIAIFGLCTFAYILMKNKLAKKLSNKSLGIKISQIYYYIYLAVIVFLSRFIAVYMLKDSTINTIAPSFSVGVGAYLNCGLGEIIGNQMYANAIINGLLCLIACILIKKIMLSITENDIVATTAGIMYILLPQSLTYVTRYLRYSYNVVFVLLGVWVFLKIIDETKNFNKKNNKYLIYSVILGAIQVVDIILGGSYVFWACVLVFTALAAMYVDTVHINVFFKSKLNFELKRLAEKIEKISISKLVCVTGITLAISGIATVIYSLISNANNYQMFSAQNSINILMHSRSYYLVLIICSLVFEIIGIIFNRKLDIKMFTIKLAAVCSMALTFFAVDGIYASAVFDVLIILNTVTNICNICYNREERVKLLRDKN